MNCLNCNATIEDKYCSRCSQKSSTKRFSLKRIFDYDIINGIFNIDKGLLFTVKELFTRPGHAVREYIGGKRVKYFNPFTLILLSITVLYLFSEYSTFELSDLMLQGAEEFADNFENFIKRYPRLFYLMNIPVISIFSFLYFKKSKLNIIEHIILNTYKTSAEVILSIFAIVLAFFITNTTGVKIVFGVLSALTVLYSVWFYYQFFSHFGYKKSSLIIRGVLTVITLLLLQSLIILSIII